ncbi:HAD family hydrolase [Streptomyces sp. NPDC002643]
MTAETEILRKLITPVRYVLWDMDGPICRLFAGHPAHQVARKLVNLITDRGLGGLLTERERVTTDPHAVLLGLGGRHPSSDLIAELEEWLTQQELTAASKALPTPYADVLIRTWAGQARFAITTNNSPRAAASYIATRELTDCFPYIYGRTRNLDRMKPDPYILRQALSSMGADPALTLMIGDTPTDFEAAERAGVLFLGYARSDGKRDQLIEAGVPPRHIVRTLEPVLEIVRAR